jgi:hypothetical protein
MVEQTEKYVIRIILLRTKGMSKYVKAHLSCKGLHRSLLIAYRTKEIPNHLKSHLKKFVWSKNTNEKSDHNVFTSRLDR